MIDKQKQNLNMKVQWAKFAVVLALYLLFLIWVESWLGLIVVPFIFDVYAIPGRWKDIYDQAEKNLKVLHAGVKLGTDKGKGLIPDQALALSTMLNKDHFPQVELSYEDAIRYLRKEAVNLPADTPKGYVLVTYRQVPIGWEKNIGNRANNLYPQEWKIKSSHGTGEPFIVNSL